MKILIIKLGYSETLDEEISDVVSLGDVLRTTPILEALYDKFNHPNITWLVTKEASPLLYNNPLINRLLIVDAFVPFQLMREQFDIVINLEKHSGVCAMADTINAWNHYGFRFDNITGKYQAYEKGEEFISYIKEKGSLKNQKPWQQNLIEMLDLPWNEQNYVLGYKPKKDVIYDVGLNHMVGSKWPTKKMASEKWTNLSEQLVKEKISISWQEGANNLFEYMDWIASCKVLITQDSLGLHLALALNKRVIALFGPTESDEVYFYNRGEVIKAKNYACMPCYNNTCDQETLCMNAISIQDIVYSTKKQLEFKEK